MNDTLWLEAQAFLIKAKDEMLARALDTLDKEIKEGRAAVNGRLVTAVEQNDSETRMFVLENIVENSDSIISRHSANINSLEMDGTAADSTTVQRIEELKKFLLAVGKMRMLYDYSKELDDWASDMRPDTVGKDEASMLASSLNDYRAEILAFIAKNPEDAFGREDLDIISRALELRKN